MIFFFSSPSPDSASQTGAAAKLQPPGRNLRFCPPHFSPQESRPDAQRLFCNRSRIHIKAALRHRAFPSSQPRNPPHRKMQRGLGCLYRAGRVQNRFFLCKSARFHKEAGALFFAKLLLFCQLSVSFSYFRLSATATATATVAPTMGLLPMPRKPIISTCAGTEEEPAN